MKRKISNKELHEYIMDTLIDEKHSIINLAEAVANLIVGKWTPEKLRRNWIKDYKEKMEELKIEEDNNE